MKAPKLLNIITFSKQAGVQLFPGQRFILKLYYGLDLDDRQKTIKITDKFNSRVLYRLTERDYLRYLHDEDRCNIRDPELRYELVLVLGRRTGKSTMLGLISSYELLRLLSLEDPQLYYGLPSSSQIQVTNVGMSNDQVGVLNETVTVFLEQKAFRPFITSNTLSSISVRTPNDFDHGRKRPSLRMIFKSCLTKSFIGYVSAALTFDELAYFKDEGNSYDALLPTTRSLVPRIRDRRRLNQSDVRVAVASSPQRKSGQLYKLHELGMNGSEPEPLLVVRAPTWEINPTIRSEFYRREYEQDPALFMREYGAQFRNLN